MKALLRDRWRFSIAMTASFLLVTSSLAGGGSTQPLVECPDEQTSPDESDPPADSAPPSDEALPAAEPPAESEPLPDAAPADSAPAGPRPGGTTPGHQRPPPEPDPPPAAPPAHDPPPTSGPQPLPQPVPPSEAPPVPLPADDGPDHEAPAGPEPECAEAEPENPGPPADRTLTGDESFPDGFTVPAGELWELDPTRTTTVASEANVVVEGVLRLRPSSPEVVHTLRFDNIDESEFVGAEDHSGDQVDHDDPVAPTDVGLWVIGDGQLDIEGSARGGWNRTGTDPTWQADDEVRVAPTEPGDSTTFARFEPGSPVPEVSHADRTYPSEVFNLTRNVRIEGSGDGEADPETNGRAHVWISSTQPQTIRFAELRHLGPRQSADGDTEGILGRYPLHFHMAGDGVRGSIVEGVVVAHSGNRAFVPHASHGITFRDTVAYNVFDDAYWWDPDDTGHAGPAVNLTEDLVYDHALAARVRTDPEHRGYELAGFLLGEGDDLTITDSAAVGVQGNNTASGFHWPATANGNEHNVWDFSDNLAHNNKINGIFAWQNDGNDHLIEDFVAYRNGSFGVDHGAYVNNYTYNRLILFDNGEAGIRSKAASTDKPQRWLNVDTDGILIANRALDSDTPTVFENVTLRGQIVVDERDNESGRTTYEFHNVRTEDGTPLSEENFDIRFKLSELTIVDPPAPVTPCRPHPACIE